ncbi:MAG TPA: bifunctional diguanylate cyclase/phosphodiesterase [Acidimicrobiales bacterium]|nr:bifunctional diguanylate cyclase/phosphodiesterase [Acidimicrobiales bacterium]
MGREQQGRRGLRAVMADRRAPVLASPRYMGAIGAGFYGSGTLAAGVVTALNGASLGVLVARAGLLVAGAAAAIAMYVCRERLQVWAYKFGGAVGTVLISAFLFIGPRSAVLSSLAILYTYTPLYTFFFLPARNGLRYLAFAMVAVVAATATGRIGFGEAFVVFVVSTVLAAVVIWLLHSVNGAETDELTRLPNRAGLERRLQIALQHAATRHEPMALALLDIDRFDNVNRRMGHDAADQLLARAGAILSEGVPPGSVAARYSGDGFALVLPGVSAGDAASAVDALRRELAGRNPCSAGLTEYSPGDSVTLLLSRARGALAEAKRQGRDRMNVRLSELTQADELAAGIAAGQLRVYYQPIVSLPNGELLGAEALVRWQHPKRGLVPPDKFIPMAEETGLIVDLGRFVLTTAVAAMASWPWSLKVSVNASGPELERPQYAAEVLHIVSEAGFSAKRLVIEVTESRLEQDSGTMLANLDQLRRYGARIALDDFGTGYSSLHRLSKLPIDYVKIDRSFVSVIDDDTIEAPIIAAVCTLARATGLVVVAEGIETPHQAQVLFDHGCGQGQGYHFGRPAPIENLLDIKGGTHRRVFTPGALAALREMEAKGRVDDERLTIN